MSELYKKAMDYLARREHSKQELKQKLKGDSALIDAVIAKLGQEGLQSDERFTESYIRSRMRSGLGPLRIQQELKQRGISDELIAHHLDFSPELWWDNLQLVWQKKYHEQSLASGDHREYARQARFLAQRGFDQSMIINFLNKQKAVAAN